VELKVGVKPAGLLFHSPELLFSSLGLSFRSAGNSRLNSLTKERPETLHQRGSSAN
jgi:hypothetical protein